MAATTIFQAQPSSTTSAVTYTFSAQQIGTASVDRIVVVGVVGRKANTGLSLTSVTIGGITATIARQDLTQADTNAQVIATAYAKVPTGTTADVVIVWDQAVLRSSASIYTITGSEQIHAQASCVSGSTGNPIIKNYTGGVTIGFSFVSTVATATWTGLTEQSDINFNAFASYSSASISSTVNSNLSISTDWTATATKQVTVISFRPTYLTMNVSTASGFQGKTVKARNNLVNLVPRPQLAGTGAIATGGTAYSSGTTIAGTRSVSGGKQTITATSLIGGFRRFGILVDGRGISLPKMLKSGDRLWFYADVDTTNLAAGTSAVMYTELKNTSNSSYAFPTISAAPGATKINGFVTITQDTPSIVTFYIWVGAASDFTGTSTAIFSNLRISYYPPGVSDPGYFDGDTVGCSWTGTANNSTSIMPVWQDVIMQSWDGAKWNQM